MAPLHHLFDDHHLCDPSWCHKRKCKLSEVVVTPSSPPTVATTKDVSGINRQNTAARVRKQSISMGKIREMVTPNHPPVISITGTTNLRVDTLSPPSSHTPTSAIVLPLPAKVTTTPLSNCDKQEYYRNKFADKDLWEALVIKHERCITYKVLEQCLHKFDTQKNEGMNTYVAKYAPKNKTYCKSISLEAGVKIAAGIYMVGYHFFWTEVMALLEMECPLRFEEYLLLRDTNKLKK